jgi:cell wall-associated NlpC family hydrolase
MFAAAHFVCLKLSAAVIVRSRYLTRFYKYFILEALMKFSSLTKFIYCAVSLTTVLSSCVFAADTGVISGTGVNIRNGSSTSSAIIRQGNNNEAFTVTDYENGWYKVNGSGVTGGYVNSSFFKITSADARVTGDGVNIRKGPSKSSDIIASLSSGASITVTGQSGDWYSFNYNGTNAYIYKEFVSGNFVSLVSQVDAQPTTVASAEPETQVTTQSAAQTTTAQADNTQAQDASAVSYSPAGGSSSASGDDLVAFAKQFLGTPYVYGGTSLTSGVDCSGFTYSIYNNFGISLNRCSKDQIANGTPVSTSNLVPGDLVFFNTGGNSVISHVGMYIGNGQYIHSTDSNNNQGVRIDSLNSAYAKNTYYGACRVLA